jgi:hypothetical protein
MGITCIYSLIVLYYSISDIFLHELFRLMKYSWYFISIAKFISRTKYLLICNSYDDDESDILFTLIYMPSPLWVRIRPGTFDYMLGIYPGSLRKISYSIQVPGLFSNNAQRGTLGLFNQ